jgi:hypothetical protein
VHNSGDDGKEGVRFLFTEVEGLKSGAGKFKVLGVVHRGDADTARLVEELTVLRGSEFEPRLLRRGESLAQLVEDVEGALIATLLDDTILLKKVRDDGATRDVTVVTKGDLNELTKTRRVVVLGGLGISEGLKERVALKELLLKLTLSARATSN